ncbi:MAG TPA: ornithine cyclodeaminase family protein [Bacteroidales bacterium]|nr:ornithine cyclodeaminase family protein [Bacteroidales bacterium]
MIFIDSQQIKIAATYTDWIDSMEKALLQDPATDFIMPHRTHLDFENNTLLIMPCINKEYISTKLISLFPANLDIGKPLLSGLVILNNGITGEPLAVLDGSTITAMRTAGVGSVGVRHLSVPDVENLGIIGLGTQGIYQAIFACSERDFRRIYIFDCCKSSTDNFRSVFSPIYPHIEIIQADDARQLCEESEVIITATNSSSPVIPDEREILYGKTVIGIGSYKPDMREFPDTLFNMIEYMFIDTLHGMKESGDLLEPVKKRILNQNQFITIDKVIRGVVAPGPTSVFKTVGMALFDLYGAKLVYESIIHEHQEKLK